MENKRENSYLFDQNNKYNAHLNSSIFSQSTYVFFGFLRKGYVILLAFIHNKTYIQTSAICLRRREKLFQK